VYIVEIGFAVGVEVDVEFCWQCIGPSEKTFVDSSNGVLHVVPLLFGGCSTIELSDYLVRDN